MRSRRQPARSGTRISSPRCSSGSLRIHQPPGPSRPRWNGGLSSPPRTELAIVCAGAGRGWGVERAVDDLGDQVSGARRARPGRSPSPAGRAPRVWIRPSRAPVPRLDPTRPHPAHEFARFGPDRRGVDRGRRERCVPHDLGGRRKPDAGRDPPRRRSCAEAPGDSLRALDAGCSHDRGHFATAKPLHYGQRSPRLNVIASKGRMLTASSSFAHAMSTHCPSRSSNASNVRSTGSMSHR